MGIAILSVCCVVLLSAVGGLLWKVNEIKQKHRASDMELESLGRSVKERQFVNETLLELGAVIRLADAGFQELLDNFLFRLADKLGAGYGCMFLFDEAGKTLKLSSQYAVDSQRLPEKTIKPGETLIGEAYYDSDPRVVNSMPGNYIHINSGLGNSKPVQLLFIPLHFNGTRLGIIELAGFSKFTESHIEIAREIAETFTATLISARAQDLNAQLLKDTEQQALSLKLKERELEDTIEELKTMQQAADDMRKLSEKRIEEHMNSQKLLMEKVVKKYESHEESLRKQLELVQAENEALKRTRNDGV